MTVEEKKIGYTIGLFGDQWIDGTLSEDQARQLVSVFRRRRLARIRRYGPPNARRWVLSPRNKQEWRK